MNLQEKINQRIEQLEEDIQRTNKRRQTYSNMDNQFEHDISILEDKVDLLVDFIKELKQLLNN